MIKILKLQRQYILENLKIQNKSIFLPKSKLIFTRSKLFELKLASFGKNSTKSKPFDTRIPFT